MTIPKFKKTWGKNFEDEMTVGRPFHIEQSPFKPRFVRFVYDEVTNMLALMDTKGNTIFLLENGDIKKFFKEIEAFRKDLKAHPLEVLD